MMASICSVWIEPSDLLFMCVLRVVIGVFLNSKCWGGMWNCIEACSNALYAAWSWNRRCMEVSSSDNKVSGVRRVVRKELKGVLKVDGVKLHTLPMWRVAWMEGDPELMCGGQAVAYATNFVRNGMEICFAGELLMCGLEVAAELLAQSMEAVRRWWPMFLRTAREETNTSRAAWVRPVVTAFHNLIYGPDSKRDKWRSLQRRLRYVCRAQDFNFEVHGRPPRRRPWMTVQRELVDIMLGAWEELEVAPFSWHVLTCFVDFIARRGLVRPNKVPRKVECLFTDLDGGEGPKCCRWKPVRGTADEKLYVVVTPGHMTTRSWAFRWRPTTLNDAVVENLSPFAEVLEVNDDLRVALLICFGSAEQGNKEPNRHR